MVRNGRSGGLLSFVQVRSHLQSTFLYRASLNDVGMGRLHAPVVRAALNIPRDKHFLVKVLIFNLERQVC